MIIYTCPKCGGDLQFSVIDTYPPIHVTECPKCGWKEENREKIERIPYKAVSAVKDVVWDHATNVDEEAPSETYTVYNSYTGETEIHMKDSLGKVKFIGEVEDGNDN